MIKRTISNRYHKKINNIRSEVMNKYELSIRNSYIRYSDSYLYPDSDSDLYTIHLSGIKDINSLDHGVTNKLNNKNQCNVAIAYGPKFDHTFILSSSPPMDPFIVVAVSLRGNNKNRSTINTGLICLWVIRATNSMSKIKYPGDFYHSMCSNKVEYITASGTYCTTHDAKVPLCMPDFSIRKIILYRFRADNNKGDLGIVY